jgi:hypothetical protein
MRTRWYFSPAVLDGTSIPYLLGLTLALFFDTTKGAWRRMPFRARIILFIGIRAEADY